MGNASFSEDFKRDSVCRIMERRYPVPEVSKCLGAD